GAACVTTVDAAAIHAAPIYGARIHTAAALRGGVTFIVLHSRIHRAVAPSRASSALLRSTPQRYPDSAPSLRTTRCHGIATVIAVVAHDCASVRTDLAQHV